MPRRARMYLPGLPYHVVQRGNNREACFIEAENYQFYLLLWQDQAQRYGLAVHAYVLMTNHVHFLVTPEQAKAVSNTMKVVGSRYAQYINKKYRRTGTLWEGRHRASLVHPERYLLTCMRYIELNPVRAQMVKRPEEYRWSSYGANSRGDHSWLNPHPEYLQLGPTPAERGHAYREQFKQLVIDEELNLIRKAAQYCLPTGDDRFRQQIEQRYSIQFGLMGRGRPRKETNELLKV